MTGVPADLLMPEDFVVLRMSLVDAVGFDAAVLLERVRWKCERRPDGWVATFAELTAETRLSERRLKGAVTVLRELGWLVSENAGQGTRTLRWKVVLDPNGRSVPMPKRTLRTRQKDVASVCTSYREDVDNNNPPDAHAPGAFSDSDQPLLAVVADAEPPPQPDDTGPPKTAQTLVARWVDGHRSTGQADPPGPFLKRVAGQCGNLARSCKTPADWVAAWHAAYAAGAAGRVDPVPMMVAQQQRTAARGGMGTNVFLDLLNSSTGPAIGAPDWGQLA